MKFLLIVVFMNGWNFPVVATVHGDRAKCESSAQKIKDDLIGRGTPAYQAQFVKHTCVPDASVVYTNQGEKTPEPAAAVDAPKAPAVKPVE